MRLELKRQEPKNGAIPGELYADGLFFGLAKMSVSVSRFQL